MIRKGLVLFSTLLVLVALTACGGNGTPGPSPAAPSVSTPPPAAGGATITGRVVGVAAASGAGLRALDVMTVTATVGGVTVTATIDGEGKFVLTGLPGGDISLTFSGTAARLTIEKVGKSENVKIVVTISGGTATLDTEERQIEGKVELEGRIAEIPEGSADAFYVGETLVTLQSGAVVRHGETPVAFDTLKVGDRVHVRGVPGLTAGSIAAELVIVQNTNAKVPANLKGKISAPITGACPDLSFKLSGWTVVVVGGSTTYSKGKDCTNLVVGAGVHVKGTVVAGKVEARTVQFDSK